MTAVVATLFEPGHYELGVAALLNSLFHAGFRGRVWCGVRGAPPEWLDAAIVEQRVGAAFTIATVAVDTDYHLQMYKPHFMKIVAQREPTASSLVYLDPDVVVKCAWPFVDRWSTRGIAAVADEAWFMPSSSPVRRDWASVRQELGVVGVNRYAPLSVYCNSGFVGVSRHCEAFWSLWGDLIDEVVARGEAQAAALHEGRRVGAWHTDQDLFNIALTDWGRDACIMGPEAMDFAPGGNVFSHAIGAPKPWQRHFIRSALAGHPPSKRDREHLRYSVGPFRLRRLAQLRRSVLAYKVARAIGLVIHRSDY